MSISISPLPLKPKQLNSGWERLKQQELSAWQPIFSPKGISPLFLLFGVILIPLGVLVFTMSQRIQEISIDYTDCLNANKESCADMIKNAKGSSCTCLHNFVVNEPMKGKIRLYYGLTNFYQNHREYVDSRDDEQLLGKIFSSGDNTVEPSQNCEPLDKDKNGRIYLPCGAIANSMFNDTFQLFHHGQDGSKTEVKLVKKGIAWESDKKNKFKNPDRFMELQDPTNPLREKFVRPKDWGRDLWDLDPSDPSNNGLKNEDLIVWFRISALPNFRKMHRFIDSTPLGKKDELPPGNYSFEITYNYEVVSFGGTKSLVLTEQEFFGGSNITLGIMMMTVGSFVLLLGFIFLLLGLKNKRKTWSRSSSIRGYGTTGTTHKLTSIRGKVA